MKPPAKTCLRCSAVLVLDISSLTRCELVRSLASGLTWSGHSPALTPSGSHLAMWTVGDGDE